jgi:hypothetical protein
MKSVQPSRRYRGAYTHRQKFKTNFLRIQACWKRKIVKISRSITNKKQKAWTSDIWVSLTAVDLGCPRVSANQRFNFLPVSKSNYSCHWSYTPRHKNACGNGEKDTCNLELGTRWRWVVSFMIRPLSLGGYYPIPRAALDAVTLEIITDPVVNRTPVVQPLASPFMNWAIPIRANYSRATFAYVSLAHRTGWQSSKVLDQYSGYAQLESRPGHGVPWVFLGFPRSLQVNAQTVLRLRHGPFLPNPFQFIIHL